VIPTHYNCIHICILALTTLKVATWVAETCWWSLYEQIIS